MQYAARVTQPHHAATIEQMRIDPRCLGRDVGTQPHHATRELIDQLTRYVLPHLKRYESRALLHAGWKRAKRSAQ